MTTLVALCGMCVLAVPSAARADADPPSDLLLGTPIYFPYQPAVSPALESALARVVAQLHRKGLNLKVAIVATRIDLGAIPALFGKPQTYAEFLEQEIALNGPQPLLVVMPAGFGLSHAGPPGVLGGLSVDSRHGANGLTRSAILAVVRIARASGRPVHSGPLPSASVRHASGTSLLAIVAAAACGLLLVGAAVGLARRRRPKDAAGPASGPPS